MGEVQRTTTTGDPQQDLRSKGDGASDRPGDDLHHDEDARLLASSRGFLAAWRERLRREPLRRRKKR